MAEKRRLRVLFSSNAPFSTSGYGTQMYDLLPLVRDAGFEVAVVCFYGLEGGAIALDGIKMYPKMADQWGADAVINHQHDFKADCVITLQDIWVLDPNAIRQFKNWIPIVPIDHEPAPEAVVSRLKMAYRIVSYSQFGHDELKRLGMHSTFIPHTVDTAVLKPQNKLEVRKKLSIPEDIYLFGMVAANKDNPPRKSFQEAMDAFKLFQEKHPKSGMYFHTLLEQQGGFPIKQYAKKIGISGSIYEIPPYDLMYKVPRSGMSAIYSAMDCLLLPSTNEGFGVPAIEAQSCGVPVIVNNFTAMPELVEPGKTGFVCDVLTKRLSPLLSYVGVPSTESLHQQMEKVFSSSPEKMSVAARERMIEYYDLHKVFKEKWVPFLTKVESELVT